MRLHIWCMNKGEWITRFLILFLSWYQKLVINAQIWKILHIRYAESWNFPHIILQEVTTFHIFYCRKLQLSPYDRQNVKPSKIYVHMGKAIQSLQISPPSQWIWNQNQNYFVMFIMGSSAQLIHYNFGPLVFYMLFCRKFWSVNILINFPKVCILQKDKANY